MSVSMKPGATTLTVIPRLPTSRASARPAPISPAFDAAYGTCPPDPMSPTTEPMKMMRPPRARTMPRTHRRATRDRTEQVRPQDLRDGVLLQRHEEAVAAHAGVGDQDTDRSQLGFDRAHRLVDRVGRGHLARRREEPLHSPLAARDRDRMPGGRQGLGARQADPPVSSGDERDRHRAAQAPTAWKPPSTWRISPVVAGNQSDSSATLALATAVESETFQPSGARSDHTSSNRREPGDRLRRQRLHRTGCHEVDPDVVRTEVPGEVAADRLERRLRHAHPVICGPRQSGIEVETDDRTAARLAHQRREPDRQALEAVSADVQRDRYVLPRRIEEAAAEATRRCVADRVQHTVDPTPSGREVVPELVDVRRLGDVQFEHRRIAELAGDPPRQGQAPTGSGQDDLRAFLLGEGSDRKRKRRVGEDTGDHDPLAVEKAGHGCAVWPRCSEEREVGLSRPPEHVVVDFPPGQAPGRAQGPGLRCHDLGDEHPPQRQEPESSDSRSM